MILYIIQQVYVEKALQIPSDKLRQKLIQATQIIIQLVREREEWKAKEEELKTQLTLLKENLKQHEELVIASTDDVPVTANSPPTPLPTSLDDIRQENIPPPQTNNVLPLHREPLPLHKEPHKLKRFELIESQHQSRPQPLSSCQLNIPDILTPRKSRETPLSVEIPHNNPSLSPLRFSDSSYSSGIQGLQKALQLVEGDSEVISPNRKSSTPIRSEEENELMIKGKKASCAKRGKSKTTAYNAPCPIVSKPKIRNYNIKDD